MYLQPIYSPGQADDLESFLDQLLDNGGPYTRAGSRHRGNTSGPSLHCRSTNRETTEVSIALSAAYHAEYSFFFFFFFFFFYLDGLGSLACYHLKLIVKL
jgi:hypothetical protein